MPGRSSLTEQLATSDPYGRIDPELARLVAALGDVVSRWAA
jgi:hypothetical protein